MQNFQTETFIKTTAKPVILNFPQKSEESNSLFYKDSSLSLRMTNGEKWSFAVVSYTQSNSILKLIDYINSFKNKEI